ncbi:T9SS type A sorting domain-containing protein [Agriterribacter sp.]|uniref:T9SS type A sorting domain-containing protein n=1 Tax=Agriterribacter sp. TaxID=2821509 RepID=UPI002B6A863A|nr:T9SS type A sorting domain-containing protein [Agriterribacter sp.]HRP56893.1 T9SS type A sorting domain-containing protein [Agriterribacter sp.]
MKSTLLLILSTLITTVAAAQYEIPSGNLDPGITHSDEPDDGTLVLGITNRLGGVRYNHTNRLFTVNNNTGWLTQFNYRAFPEPFGMTSTNTDYFLYQGTNEIAGDGGIIVFDTVHFNIGAGNTMHITNYHEGTFLSPYGEVSGGIMIGRALYFNNGITTTNRINPVQGAIVFINNAFYDGGLTDAQHVDGFVSETNYPDGDNLPLGHGGDFTFPVGNGSNIYQVRRQGTFTDPDHILTVGWVDGDPNNTADPTPSSGFDYNPTALNYRPPGIAGIAKEGFWDWHYQEAIPSEPAEYNGVAMIEDQTITVSIPDLSNYPGLQAGDLRLLGFDPRLTEFKWIDLSTGSGLPAPYANGISKGSTLQGIIPAGQVISALAIGSTNNIILPVTFTSFTVKADGCKALLEWQTGMEQNNSHFVVERSSNGNEFTAIGRVGAVGNSNSLNTYRFTDEAPAGGVNYYRIRQVDFDGKHSSTDIKAVRIQCNGNAVALKAYPNPAASQVNIRSGKAVAQVNIVASNGQTVMKYIPSQNQGGTFSLNIQRIQKGIYLLQVVNKDGTIDVIKLLKQ